MMTSPARVASARTNGTSASISVRISMLGGASAENKLMLSATTARRSVGASAVSPSTWLNVRIFCTTFRARRADAMTRSRSPRDVLSRGRSCIAASVNRMMGTSTLLNSCAMPPASVQTVTMAQLLLQLIAPGFRDLLFQNLLPQAIVHAHQFAAHRLQVRREIVQFPNAGADLQRLGVVAGGDGARHVLQPPDWARQSIAQVGGRRDRGSQIDREQKQHPVERQLNALLGRAFVESHAQFGALAGMLDGERNEVQVVAARREAQIRTARCFDVRRSERAADGPVAVHQLGIQRLAVNDREIEEVGRLRRRVKGGADLEL